VSKLLPNRIYNPLAFDNFFLSITQSDQIQSIVFTKSIQVNMIGMRLMVGSYETLHMDLTDLNFDGNVCLRFVQNGGELLLMFFLFKN
jgi:hypothetical protein